MKIKWEVADAPSGKYRTFEKRGWPTGYVGDDRTAFSLRCDDSYVPANVKSGNHQPIYIYVAQYMKTDEDRRKYGAFKWLKFKKTASTLAEAKKIAQEFANKRPEFFETE